MSFFKFARDLTRMVLMPLFRVKYHNVENVPKQGGYILAPNHRMALDPLFVSYRIPQDISFMGKEELFKNPLLRLLFEKGLKAFPVSRGKGDTGAIDTAVQRVKEGGILGIFPEGTRSKTGKLGVIKSGVMVVAAQTGAPILPVAIKIDKPGLFCRIDITCGKLITCEELGVTVGEYSPRSLRQGKNILTNWNKEQLGQND